MKYTVLFIRYLLITLLTIIMVFSFTAGIIFGIIGIFVPAVSRTPGFLIFIPVALVSTFVGFVTMDGINYLMDRWELQ